MKSLPLTRPMASALALALMIFGAAYPAAARAANAGQADLDKATELKLGAQSSSDLTDVVHLCESALKKGLDKNNATFANDLMASALAQRGGISAAKIFGDETSPLPRMSLQNDAWKTYRDDALADLEKALKLSPKQPQAHFTVARLNLLPGGSAEKAMKALNETIALSDDDPPMRARALLLRSSFRTNVRQRVTDLDEAVKALPGNAMLLRARGLALAEDQNWDASLADFDKSIAADPGNLGAYVLKATVLAELKKYPEALAALDKAHALAPDNAELLLAKAKIYVAQVKYKEAAGELTRALAINGSDLSALQLRSAIYEQQGNTDKALADIDRILEIKPGNAEFMRLRARLLAVQHKFDKAVEELLKMHKANPNDSLTTLTLGLVYEMAKQHDKALAAFDEVLARNPDDMDALRGRAEVYETAKQYDKAVTAFDEVLARRRDDLIALRGRADALLNLGRRGDALAEYEKAYKLQPHDYGILNNFAWVLATAPEDKLRDGRRALDMATEACKLTDYKADYILSTLAAACAETGDFASARKYAAQAVEVSPVDKDEPDRKDELKKELQSYKANKKWREALVNGVEVKADEQKSQAQKGDGQSTSADPAKGQREQPDKPKKKKKKKKPAPPPEEEGEV
jgi:tetratricopeptide (TPR) repeat protein